MVVKAVRGARNLVVPLVVGLVPVVKLAEKLAPKAGRPGLRLEKPEVKAARRPVRLAVKRVRAVRKLVKVAVKLVNLVVRPVARPVAGLVEKPVRLVSAAA